MEVFVIRTTASARQVAPVLEQMLLLSGLGACALHVHPLAPPPPAFIRAPSDAPYLPVDVSTNALGAVVSVGSAGGGSGAAMVTIAVLPLLLLVLSLGAYEAYRRRSESPSKRLTKRKSSLAVPTPAATEWGLWGGAVDQPTTAPQASDSGAAKEGAAPASTPASTPVEVASDHVSRAESEIEGGASRGGASASHQVVDAKEEDEDRGKLGI